MMQGLNAQRVPSAGRLINLDPLARPMPPLRPQDVKVEDDDVADLEPADAAYISVQDVHGFSLEPVLMPRTTPSLVVYASGPFVVVWDWKADRKSVHRQHRYPVTCMAFNTTGSRMATADADRLLVWDTATWTVRSRSLLPKGKSEPWKESDGARQREFVVYAACFVASGRQIVTMEKSKEIAVVQCMRVWSLDNENLSAISEVHISQDAVHSLRCRPESGGIYLCSNGLVSMWTCLDKTGGGRSTGLVKGWTLSCEVKPEIFVGAEVASSMGWVLVVVSDGSIIVVSDVGEKLRTVRRDNAVFTSCCMDGGDCLLVGTARGTVLWYNVPSMDVWRRLPYDMELRDSMQANPAREVEEYKKTLSGPLDALVNVCGGVRADSLNAHLGLCLRTTADRTISVLDLSTGSVCNALFGHLKQINCLTASRSARTAGVCVYTGSRDETLGMWELDEAKGVSCSQHRFLDMSSFVHPSLSYRRGLAASLAPQAPYAELSKLQPPTSSWQGGDPLAFTAPERGRGTVRVCSVAVDSSCQLLACGTSHGCCLVYELRTCRQRAMVDVCRPAVAGLEFAPGGKYLVARSAHGWVWVLDSLCGFRKSVVVQEPAGVRNSTSYWQCHDVKIVGELIPTDTPAVVLDRFHVITLYEPRTVAVYQVRADRVGEFGRGLEPVAKIALRDAPLCMALHASHHYIYTISERAMVEVNHLNSQAAARGGLLAVPPVPEERKIVEVGNVGRVGKEEAQDSGGKGWKGVCVACDSSGLFLATVTVAKGNGTSCLILWEAATGEYVDSMSDLPLITCLSFTQDSAGLVAGCVGGALLHFKLAPELARDARFVMLGGPSELLEEQADEDVTSKGGLYTRQKRGEASSGFDRYERLMLVPDVVSRALCGTSARSIHAIWSDKPVQLPPLPNL